MTKPVRRLAATALFTLGLAGCMEQPPSLTGGMDVPTVPVKGTVRDAKGQPLKGGVITLEPLADSGSTNQATGEVKDDGTFEVRTGPNSPGAMVGKYRVKVENAETTKTLTKSGKEIQVEVKEGGSDLEIKLP